MQYMERKRALQIRLTEAEYKQVEQSAKTSRMSVSAFVRSEILIPVVIPPYTDFRGTEALADPAPTYTPKVTDVKPPKIRLKMRPGVHKKPLTEADVDRAAQAYYAPCECRCPADAHTKTGDRFCKLCPCPRYRPA